MASYAFTDRELYIIEKVLTRSLKESKKTESRLTSLVSRGQIDKASDIEKQKAAIDAKRKIVMRLRKQMKTEPDKGVLELTDNERHQLLMIMRSSVRMGIRYENSIVKASDAAGPMSDEEQDRLKSAKATVAARRAIEQKLEDPI